MATSSFGRSITIDKNNYKSLHDIINDKTKSMTSFKNMRKIELVKKEDIKKWFK